MTDEVYIVANEQQELQILNNFEEKGFRWNAGYIPTSFVPSERLNFEEGDFPYMLMIANDNVWLSRMKTLEDKKIVYDGRKEEKMYKVTQEFMNKMIEWRDDEDLNATNGESCNYVNRDDLYDLPDVAVVWWVDDNEPIERNNRLIAIIQWLNGEDVFEVEAPRKFVVRSEERDDDGDYWYVLCHESSMHTSFMLSKSTKFDTREEAQEWANSHQVVIEIGEEGNEVE